MATSDSFITFEFLNSTFFPIFSDFVLVLTISLLTARILAKASPLKPNVLISYKSSNFSSLLVECLLNANSISFFSIPDPLSLTDI